MFGPTQSSSMMPFLQQMMQGGSNPFASPMGGMPPMQNNAPQIPMRNGQAPSSFQQPPPLPQQGQQSGFFQNMMSSPTQMATGMNLIGGNPGQPSGGQAPAGGSPGGGGGLFGGLGSLVGNFGTQAAGPMAGGAAGYTAGGSGLLGGLGSATGAAATGSSPFWGGLSSMMGGGGQATGLLSLLGLA
jgi:hypothetical protein